MEENTPLQQMVFYYHWYIIMVFVNILKYILFLDFNLAFKFNLQL